MPRYYFDTDDDDLFVHDEEGIILPHHEAARRYALAALPDMALDTVPDDNRCTFLIAVRDEAGDVIYRATLRLTGEWVEKLGA